MSNNNDNSADNNTVSGQGAVAAKSLKKQFSSNMQGYQFGAQDEDDETGFNGVSPLECSNMWTPSIKYGDPEDFGVVVDLLSMREHRKKWLWTPDHLSALSAENLEKARNATTATLRTEGEFGGIFQVGGIEAPGGLKEFIDNYRRMVDVCCAGPTGSFCYKRCRILEASFRRHQALFMDTEQEQKATLANDIYTVHKVDTHIHAAAALQGGEVVKFVRTKIREDKDAIVKKEQKNPDGSIKCPAKTLGDICQECGINEETITANFLKFQADSDLMKRFDRFNAKYNLAGVAAMRDIFLKLENDQDGEYFAEMLLNEMKSFGPDYHTEMRLSIYGRKKTEWRDLARICDKWELCDGPKLKNDVPKHWCRDANRFMIQVPRVYRVWRSLKFVKSFGETIDNIFAPIFEATLYPERDPKLTNFLASVGGFDSVDDESQRDCDDFDYSLPHEWTSKDSPSYQWQVFFMGINIYILNQLRAARGMNTFSFRPHAGESGDEMHLAATYMLAESVNHGINLDKNTALQYLYYLDQVGLAVSPTSNNFLFVPYAQNPVAKLFRRGLFVSLSTDDPTFFHLSKDPLMEEYSICRNQFGLSLTDLCEIARNSVLMSSFPHETKKNWLGDDYESTHDPNMTSIPQLRMDYRHMTHKTELGYLDMLMNHKKTQDHMTKWKKLAWREVEKKNKLYAMQMNMRKELMKLVGGGNNFGADIGMNSNDVKAFVENATKQPSSDGLMSKQNTEDLKAKDEAVPSTSLPPVKPPATKTKKFAVEE